jgi:hypothetical protein
LKALARWQDKVKPFPCAQVEEIVASELGIRISKAFSCFEEKHLAAASPGFAFWWPSAGAAGWCWAFFGKITRTSISGRSESRSGFTPWPECGPPCMVALVKMMADKPSS